MQPFQLPPVPTVTPVEALEMIQDRTAVLIDVREQDEWDNVRIPGAQLRPMSTINDWYEELPDDVTVLVHCHTGARSHAVVHALMNQAGRSNVANVEGGIAAWAQDELPLSPDPGA